MSIHETSVIEADAKIHDTCTIWQYCHVRERASIGENTTIGRAVYIGTGVTVGDNCKIQNLALIYEPAVIADGVFIRPGVIFTNDHVPRAVNRDLSVKSVSDWVPAGVEVQQGASVGAGAVCVAPVRIGEWAIVGAGAVVTRDIPAYALVVGSPARRIAWVGRTGRRLESLERHIWYCPDTGDTFRENNGYLEAFSSCQK